MTSWKVLVLGLVLCALSAGSYAQEFAHTGRWTIFKGRFVLRSRNHDGGCDPRLSGSAACYTDPAEPGVAHSAWRIPDGDRFSVGEWYREDALNHFTRFRR